jgi:uncharacterized protein YqeY
MSLKEEISSQMKEAMKAKDQAKVECLRMAMAAIKNREIEIKGDVDDAECIKLLTKLAKQRNESIEMYKKGGREELADKEAGELAIIESFLPEAMGDDELAKLVSETVAEVEAASPKDMGKVMKAIGPKVAGRADGRKVSETVRAELAKL